MIARRWIALVRSLTTSLHLPTALARLLPRSRAYYRARTLTYAFVLLLTLHAPQRSHHLVARAHRVIVGLARGALLVVVFFVVAVEDAVPRAVLVVDEVFPAVCPDLLVPLVVLLLAGGFEQQLRGAQRLGLHPEVLVVV